MYRPLNRLSPCLTQALSFYVPQEGRSAVWLVRRREPTPGGCPQLQLVLLRRPGLSGPHGRHRALQGTRQAGRVLLQVGARHDAVVGLLGF